MPKAISRKTAPLVLSDEEETTNLALPAKGGRTVGSKNKITMLKLMTEQAVRSKNLQRMLEVCDEIIKDAKDGDFACRKLVWSAVMSKAGFDNSTPAGAMPEIIIRSERPVEVHNHQVIDAEVEK